MMEGMRERGRGRQETENEAEERKEGRKRGGSVKRNDKGKRFRRK